MVLIFDLISDLHVDYWDKTDYQYDWKKMKNQDSVIISGDIADSLDTTIIELKKACESYTTVLYIYGNHEATMYYDDLGKISKIISDGMKHYPNFINLSETDYINDNVVFIGACGWWDFEMGQNETNKSIYKQKSIESFDVTWNKIEGLSKEQIVQNIINQANIEYLNLKSRILIHEKQNMQICLVTHTIPNIKVINPKRYTYSNISLMGNSKISCLINRKSIICSVYGHDHNGDLENYIDGKRYVNNARGRPLDQNRRMYFPYTLFIK